MLRLVVASVALIGCGKIGFEPNTRDAGGDATDAIDAAPPVTAIEVEVAQFVTTSPTFVDIPGAAMTIPPSPGTRWLVLVSASLQSSIFTEISVEARYLVDGVERGIGGTQVNATDRAGPWQHFYLHAGTSSPAQITVELRDAQAATATIEDLHVIAVPLPDGADPLYATADPIQLVTPASYLPLYNLGLDPATAGDYVFLLLANTSDAPDLSDIYTRWLDPGGQVWTPSLHMPRSPWQSSLFVRRATIGPDPVTITLEANTGGTMSQVQYARVLALRTDAFASFELGNDAIYQQTTSPSVTTVNTLTPTGSAARFLALVSARVAGDCINTAPADRGIHFVIGPATTTRQHVTENCSYETTYGTIRLLPTRPDELKAGFSSGNAELVVYEESSLVLIGLE